MERENHWRKHRKKVERLQEPSLPTQVSFWEGWRGKREGGKERDGERKGNGRVWEERRLIKVLVQKFGAGRHVSDVS